MKVKVEEKAIIFSAIINFFVALIKIIGGNIFGFVSLVADGFYTVSDFITDILALIGARIGKRRPNKRHPLGYGNFEYIMQMIMGFLIMLVGIVVIFMSFNIYYSKPSLIVILFILVAIGLKLYSSNMLQEAGKKINSSLLITSSKESYIDVISSSVLLLVILVSQFFKYADMIGSIFIGILIIYQAIKIIIQNTMLLIGVSTRNEKIENEIIKIFNRYRKIDIKNITLIKQGPYYHLILGIIINKKFDIKYLINAELNIKRDIRKKKLGIRLIDFDIEAK